jgi:beta-phosphoglucomutase-like phosphatase (HAD superfamily)/SAM-dependent methyltransferase
VALAAVLFDLDGVLVDSEMAGLTIARRITSEMGLTLTDGDLQGFVGISDRTFYDLLNRRYPRFDAVSALSRHEELYLSLLDDLPEVPGAVALVGECVRQGLQLAVVTGSTRMETQRILRRLGIHDLFSTVVTTEDVAVGKPNGAGYRLALHRLALQPTQAVAIEDSDPGVAAALAANLRVVALRRAWPVKQELATADQVIDELAELSVDGLRTMLRPRRSLTASIHLPERQLHLLGRKLRDLVDSEDEAAEDPWRWLEVAGTQDVPGTQDPRRLFVRGEPVPSIFLEQWLGTRMFDSLAHLGLLIRADDRDEWTLLGCCVAPLGVPILLLERPTRQASLGWRSTSVYLDAASIRYVRAVEAALGPWHGRSVLEIGCGTGILLARAGQANARRLFGLDIDRESVQVARINLLVAGVSAAIEESDMFENPALLGQSFDVIAFHPPYRIVPTELDYPNPIQRLGVGQLGLGLVYRFIEGVGPYIADGGRAVVYLQTPEGRGLTLVDDLRRHALANGLRVTATEFSCVESTALVALGVAEKFPGTSEHAMRSTLEHYRLLGVESFAGRLLVLKRS